MIAFVSTEDTGGRGGNVGRRLRREAAHTLGQMIGGPVVIGIEEGQEFSLGVPDGGVSGCANAAVRFVTVVFDAMIRMFGSKLFDNAFGSIVRGILDDDEFPRRVSLCGDRPKGIANTLGHVVGRNDDTDKRGGHLHSGAG